PPFLPKSCNVSARSTCRLGSATFRKFAPHAGLVQLAPSVLERVGIREFSQGSYHHSPWNFICCLTNVCATQVVGLLLTVSFILKSRSAAFRREGVCFRYRRIDVPMRV
ncbi:hypothetical protein ALC60_02998, partial [Trachymyrmex zeteki]